MTPSEFEVMLKDAETQLTRLKHLYDQWFQGFERLEPVIVRKQFERQLQILRKAGMRRAALRFRFQMLVQRYTTLQTYWRRVSRQIEEGTYRRDLMKVRRKREERRDVLLGKKKKRDDPDTLQDLDLDLDQDQRAYNDLERMQPHTAIESRDLERPVTQKTAAVPAHVKSNSSSHKGPGDARIRQLYEAYVREKKKNKEPVDNIDYEKLAKRIKKMIPKLEREHQGKSVDFKVVVKDGRVGLKPIVKK